MRARVNPKPPEPRTTCGALARRDDDRDRDGNAKRSRRWSHARARALEHPAISRRARRFPSCVATRRRSPSTCRRLRRSRLASRLETIGLAMSVTRSNAWPRSR